jgi:hypothetical protein
MFGWWWAVEEREGGCFGGGESGSDAIDDVMGGQGCPHF